jgi:hypothetical protein
MISPKHVRFFDNRTRKKNTTVDYYPGFMYKTNAEHSLLSSSISDHELLR